MTISDRLGERGEPLAANRVNLTPKFERINRQSGLLSNTIYAGEQQRAHLVVV